MMKKFSDLLTFVYGQIKFVLLYYVLGGKSILHDLIYRRYNRVGEYFHIIYYSTALETLEIYVQLITQPCESNGSGKITRS